MATTLTISLPAPHAAQRKVLSEALRFNVLACGRRWGKSQLGIDRVIRPALEGFPTAWLSPTYKLLLEAWRALQEVLAPVIESRNNAEMRLSLRGGGSITAFSLDAEVGDVVRGRAFRRVVIDEAALVKGLRQVWESAIRPTLADHKGDAFFLSTPRGYGDFKLFFDRGQDPEREDWASWQMPTAANPFIDGEEIEAARQEMTEAAFGQEFLAEFVSWEGAVFRHVQECAIAERKEQPEPGHEYVIGADWGRSTDFTVFSVIDVTARAMVDMDRSNRVDYVVQRARLQALYDRWRPSRIIAEQNSAGQPIIEELFRAGLPVEGFTTSNSSKATIIEALALAFEQGSIAILPDPVLLGELQAFAGEQLPSGLIRYSAPAGGHDDCVISLALAWSVIENEPLGATYRLTAANLYTDETRPISLLSTRIDHWLTVELASSQVVAVEFYDDGTTIYAEREYYRDFGHVTDDQTFFTDLIRGFGDWPGLGPDSRLWPGIIIAAEQVAIASQLRGLGAWVLEAAHNDPEDSIRRVAALLAQNKLRIHQRCSNLRRGMRLRTWADLSTTEGRRRPDPCRILAARVSTWRLQGEQ